MTDERRTTRDSKHTHGTNPEASPAAVGPMDQFLTQWMQMDQLRAKRDEQKREAEWNRQAVLQERLIQAQAEQQERMIQTLAEARRLWQNHHSEPLRLILHKFHVWSMIWVPSWTPSRQQPGFEDGHGGSGQSSYEASIIFLTNKQIMMQSEQSR